MNSIVEIKDIVKHTNVSTILILPVFDKIAENITYIRTKAPFRLIPLFYEYGMLKTFCYTDSNHDENLLHILFLKDDCNQRMTKTSVPDRTLSDLIIASEYFRDIVVYGDHCVFTLEIPDKFMEDVRLIKSGKYSRVSDEYKRILKAEGQILRKEFLRSSVGHAIIKQDLASSIVLKSPSIRQSLEKWVNGLIPEEVELYQMFSPDKETLHLNDSIRNHITVL